MAVKRSGKSSKTAHILNVLSSDLSEVTGEETKVGESAISTEGISPLSPVSDEVLATAIRDSLVQDMRREEEGVGAEAAPEIQEEEPLPTEATLPPETGQETGGMEPEVAVALPEEVAEDREDAPPQETVGIAGEEQTQPPTSQEPVQEANIDHRDFCYVNVMENLVEDKAPKYIKMFGVCSCARCVSDVKALALTNLPPKYAVMEHGRVIPMLTVYEARYSTALTSQIISACKQVMLEPRH